MGLNWPAYKWLLKDIKDHPDLLTWPAGTPLNADVLAELQNKGGEILPGLMKSIEKKLRNYQQLAPRHGLSVQDTAVGGDGIVDPSDIFGEVICAALTGISPRGNPIRSWNRTNKPLSNYLFGIARSEFKNLVRDYGRISEETARRPIDDHALEMLKKKKCKLYGHTLSIAESAIELVADHDGDAPEAPVLSQETKDAIRAALSKFPELLPVIEWKCGEATLEDIAKKYGMNKHALYNRWYRAVKPLQALLAEHRP
jgi:DNA-directed RNA polymerase specialized sigma24 family protein